MTTEKKLLGVNPSGGSDAPNVEDVFSTYLYTGTGAYNHAIDNGIDLDGEGGLVWIKNRESSVNHCLFDSARGSGGTEDRRLFTNSTSGDVTGACDWSGFKPSGLGFVLNGNGVSDRVNQSDVDYVSWTFRKKAKFFDIVTYTGNGTAGRTVSHDLGCEVGMIFVKKTSGSANWCVYHKSQGTGTELHLNKTDAATSYGDLWSGVTDTNFTISANNKVNYSGDDYVAYLFAHDPDGDDDDGMIQCGSYTGNGSSDGPEITLGWEPQYVMVKCVDASSPWTLWDVMRGLANNGTSDDKRLKADTSDSEGNSPFGHPTSTGLKITGTNGDYNTSGDEYIYMAIRAPMMKEPENATDVFDVTAGTLSNGSTQTTGFPIDMQISRSISSDAAVVIDRLRGTNIKTSASQARGLFTSSSSAENTNNNNSSNWDSTGFDVTGTFGGVNAVWWNFKRAKGFFDVVAYTGTGVAGRTVAHSLGVVPEMIIAKCRSNGASTYYWQVYHVGIGNTKSLRLNESNTAVTIPVWNNTTPTDSVFELDNWGNTNGSGETYIAYLFATLAGVSKVGSYTGTGSALNIDCGFSNGARFVLIKCTSHVGHWGVFDTERGIVAGNDAMLYLNETDAENTATDHIDPYSSGFALSGDSEYGSSGRDYIYLAIA